MEVTNAIEKNQIGLDKQQAEELIHKMNDLLANYQVFYQNVRGFHWNIKGNNFFDLHTKFEELYDDLHEKIDEVAERILALGGTPMHTFEDYASTSDVKAIRNASEDHVCVKGIVSALNIVISKQREVLEVSDRIGDEGTNNMMGDYIQEQEKLIWMYNAWIGN